LIRLANSPRRAAPKLSTVLALVAAAALAACAKSVPAPAGLGEPCVGNGDCATGFLCAAGRCVLPANLGGCEPARLRCNGADVEKCDANGLTYSTVTSCPTGCAAGACNPQLCAPGANRCEGDAAEQCTPSGGGWALVQICPSRCDAATGLCRALANCNAGDLRCSGFDAQRCVQTAPGVTAFTTVETCVAACSSGACLGGGACTSVTLHAAASVAPQDGISTVLIYSDVIVGADGSPIPDGLEYTVAVTAPAGGGQPQIASADADAAQVGVQVRSLAGRVHFKLLAPAKTAADLIATATAVLVDRPSCAGSVQVTFSAAASGQVLLAEDFTSAANRDRSATTADWDTARGTVAASFSAEVGSGSDGPLNVTSGTSLDLSTSGYAPAFSVVSLNGRTVAVDGAVNFLSGGDEVVLWNVQGSGSGFSNAGTYELHQVALVSGTQVTLAEEIVASFGTQNDQDVATQHVVLQRVPQFSSLSIALGGSLYADAWDGSRGGLLFLRVSGLATVQGEIKLDGAGYRGGGARTSGEDGSSLSGALLGGGGPQSGGSYATQGAGASAGQPYGLPLLGRLFFGAGGGGGNGPAGAGGGAIVIAAQTLSLAASDGSQQGRIHADGLANQPGAGSGAGGSIWLAARTLTLGSGTTGALSAQGGPAALASGAAGGAGRVRIDYLAADDLGRACSRATPACSSAVAGPLLAQASDFYAPIFSTPFSSATLVAAIGQSLADDAGNSLVVYQASGAVPADFEKEMSLTGPGTIKFSSAGPGPNFHWRALLSPLPGAPQLLLGVQWQLSVN